MSIRMILFDLDGTLLPMDQDTFVNAYCRKIAAYMAPYGYDPQMLVKNIWTGTGAMVQNDGAATNEAVFWKLFEKFYGPDVQKDIPKFEEFYKTKFNECAEACGKNPMAAQAIQAIKAAGFRIALATNPLFPAVATQNRIRWAGLTPEDFELYTTYENSVHCKPNLAYYQDICHTLEVAPEECLMVGNDVGEDMVAEKLGMKVFLLTDCLINKPNADINQYPHGSFEDLLTYIQTL